MAQINNVPMVPAVSAPIQSISPVPANNQIALARGNPSSFPVSEESKKSVYKNWWFWVLIALIVAGLGFLVYWFASTPTA